jgi:hypothetical protein
MRDIEQCRVAGRALQGCERSFKMRGDGIVAHKAPSIRELRLW